ncbi:MAG: DUF4147 domain-containing protein, partial [Gemmatimonadales bacterium]
MPTTPLEPRALLADLYWTAVKAVAPGPALRLALEAEPGPAAQRVHLLALGKAAGPMAEEAVAFLQRIGRQPAGGLLVVPEATASPDPSLTVLVGDHPIPGEGSLAASDRLGEQVRAVRAGDEVWVLLSGGASSLIAAPLPEISRSDLVGLFGLLLGSGLDIAAMNRVRKRFTRWAGGRLGVSLSHAIVKNFTISDVINVGLASIGSGPCVADPTTAEELIEFLTQQEMWEPLSPPLQAYLLAAKAGHVA